MNKTLKNQLKEEILAEGLLEEGGRYVLALSGGADSVCLLHLMMAISRDLKLDLMAVHVNHGLRENASADEVFCRRLCDSLNLPFRACSCDVSSYVKISGQSTEEAARTLRYRELIRVAREEGYQAVLSGQHLDDQAETLLLNLLRGSGLGGLSAMRPLRLLADDILLIRPLLKFSRQRIEDFLMEEGLSWREDESNQDTLYTRNFIRHEILSRCKRRFPNAAAHMGQTAGQMQEIEDFLREEARQRLDAVLEKDHEDMLIPLSLFRDTKAVLRHYMLRAILENPVGLKDISAAHYNAMDALPEKQSGAAVFLPGRRILIREQKHLRLHLNTAAGKEDLPPLIRMECFPYDKTKAIPAEPYTKWMDYDIIDCNVALRKRRPGDYFLLPGGHKKNLARYLVDEKIPLARRNDLWLLAKDSHVLWILGGRLSEGAKVGPHTKTVAQFSVEQTED